MQRGGTPTIVALGAPSSPRLLPWRSLLLRPPSRHRPDPIVRPHGRRAVATEAVGEAVATPPLPPPPLQPQQRHEVGAPIEPRAGDDPGRTGGTESRRARRAVGTWLLGVSAATFGIVVLGGLTRLTESGLSIVAWEPIKGMRPPSSPDEWSAEFARYKDSPEYRYAARRPARRHPSL